MEKRDFYEFIKQRISPIQIARHYLGRETETRGDSIIYYSPMRPKERTPSFYVNNEKGIHDFGTNEHYNVINFVAKLLKISYWEATKEIFAEFDLDINEVKHIEEIKKYEKSKNPTIKIVQGNKPKTIVCYFDQEEFRNKPKDNYILGGIKNRIINNSFKVYANIEQIQNEILRGKTCIPSAIKGNPKENWRQQQIFLIDFDNKLGDENYTTDNPKHIFEDDVLKYCRENNILPTFIYNTFSHTEFQHKFRLVYVFETPITNIELAKQILIKLLDDLKAFNPDISKKNLGDMFLGGINIYYSSDSYYKLKGEN